MSRTTKASAFVLVAILAVASLAHAATTGSTSTPAPAKKSTSSTAHHAPSVDLNSATSEQLMKLPGITEEVASKIIAARPFKSKSELKSKKIVTDAEYSKIASHVMVKAEPAKASK